MIAAQLVDMPAMQETCELVLGPLQTSERVLRDSDELTRVGHELRAHLAELRDALAVLAVRGPAGAPERLHAERQLRQVEHVLSEDLDTLAALSIRAERARGLARLCRTLAVTYRVLRGLESRRWWVEITGGQGWSGAVTGWTARHALERARYQQRLEALTAARTGRPAGAVTSGAGQAWHLPADAPIRRPAGQPTVTLRIPA